jgi:hypothetical protein
MHRTALLVILAVAGFLLFNWWTGNRHQSQSGYTQVRNLAAENEELRQRNADLADLQDRTLSELEKVRKTADRTDVALRSSYLGYAPLGVALVILGGGLAVTCVLIIRRQRRCR